MKFSAYQVLLLTFFGSTLIISCEEEEVNSFDLPYFSKIVAMDDIQLELLPGPIQGVSGRGPGDFSDLRAEVIDEVLFLTGNVGNNIISIVHPSIDSIVLKNSTELQLVDDFQTTAAHLFLDGFDAGQLFSPFSLSVDSLVIRLRNAARVAIDSVQTNRLQVNLLDGTRCNLQGFASFQQLVLNNGCRFNLDFGLTGWEIEAPILGDSVFIEVDNGGNGWVQATTYLHALGRNDSRVFFKGNPESIESMMSNGASLVQKED